MDLTLRNAEHFSLLQRDRADGFALMDPSSRISLHKKPPLFAIMMILEAQSFTRLDVDRFEIPTTSLIPSIIFSPGADGLRCWAARGIDHPRRRLHFAALSHIEDHFDSELFAQCDFRNVLRHPIAAVGEDCWSHLCERAGNAFVGIAFFVIRKDDFVDERKVLDDLGALFLWHECEAFFHAEPMVVVHNDDELVTQFSRLFKKPYMADVKRVKAARNRHPSCLSLLFLHANVACLKKA